MSLYGVDGTTRRITNWVNLTKEEQDNTWRLIKARNQKRIEELKRKQQEALDEQKNDVSHAVATEGSSGDSPSEPKHANEL